MSVIDVFLYDAEAEMVCARVAALHGLVDDMVAVFANRTHQGEVIFDDESDGAVTAAIDDLLVHDITGAYMADLSMHDGLGRSVIKRHPYQVREREQRNAMAIAASYCEPEPGDILLISDIDEIPSPAAIEHMQTCPKSVHVCEQLMSVFSLRWQYPQVWLGTVGLRYGEDTGLPLGPQQARNERGAMAEGGSAIPNGGAHLSWMGGIAACERKRRRISHGEALYVDDLGFDYCHEHGVDVNGVQLTRVAEDDLVLPTGLRDRAHRTPDYWLAC